MVVETLDCFTSRSGQKRAIARFMGEWYDETEDYLYLRVMSIIFQDDDDDGDPEQEIKGIVKAAILPGRRHDVEIEFEWEAKLREIQKKGDE